MATLRTHDSCLLVIDMQTRLLPAIADQAEVVATSRRLLKAAGMLDVPTLATEHWADKIGPTEASLQPLLNASFQKTHFDATQEEGFQSALPRHRHRVLLVGVEAHVCVLQTGLGLAGMGYSPVLVADAIGSRDPADKDAACARWMHHGLEVVTSEMVMFEWLQTPSHPRFRDVLALVKE